MDRKQRIDILISALYAALPGDMTMQEGLDAFISGRLPLRDERGIKLNPYDYIGVTGKPYVRFEKESQEKMADRLNYARKPRGFQASDENKISRMDRRISRLELVLTAVEKALLASCRSSHTAGCANGHSQCRSSRNTRRDGNNQGYSLSCEKGECQEFASGEPRNFSGLARFYEFLGGEGQ